MQTKRRVEDPWIAPRTATLRLARGVSTHVVWLLRDAPSASTVTIGSDPGCDWQVHGEGVVAHALSVALLDGSLFVASGPRAEAALEGSLLPEIWQRVDESAHVDFGNARIELVWDAPDERYADMTASGERDRPTLPPEALEMSAKGKETNAGSSRREQAWRASDMDSPTLLGRAHASRASSQLLRYAGLLLFTALMYRAWLLLLDRL